MMKFRYRCSSSDVCTPIHIELTPGKYFIECYGAQGGYSLQNGKQIYQGGKGAYTAGILLVRERLPIYLYIGGKGSDASRPNKVIPGGWNGGGAGRYEEGDDDVIIDDAGAGGGSTDIRLTPGEWNDIISLRSRIMVAAGGSASCFCAEGNPGGDFTGFIRSSCSDDDFQRSDTNQTNGYKFGVGEDGRDFVGHPGAVAPYTGAGGGYYGGKTRYPIAFQHYVTSSSSGSSYVSGHPKCNSISEDGEHSGSPIHYSKRYFLNPIMKNGFSEFPSFEDLNPVKGHEGNGAIRITLLTPYTQQCTRRIHLSYLFFLFCFGS